MQLTKVFVYGTLRMGYGNHRLIEKSPRSKFIGEGETKDKFKMIYMGFPGIIRDNEKEYTTIKGELYLVDLETLQSLDILEGTPNFYRREKITVLSNGKKHNAYTYILNTTFRKYTDHQAYPLIENGDYTTYVERKDIYNSKF